VTQGRPFDRLSLPISLESPKDTVKFSIFPRNSRFFDLFEELGKRLVTCSEMVVDLLGHFENVDMKTTRIKEIEHEADTLTHDLYTLINQTFVTPFDREDIVALAQRLDDVVDDLEAATTAIRVYGIQKPTQAARGLADIARLQCLQLNVALEMLRRKGRLRDLLAMWHCGAHRSGCFTIRPATRQFAYDSYRFCFGLRGPGHRCVDRGPLCGECELSVPAVLVLDNAFIGKKGRSC